MADNLTVLQKKLEKATAERIQVEEDITTVIEEHSLQEQIALEEEKKKAVITEATTKKMGLMAKAVDKLESSAEGAANSSAGFGKVLGAFGDKLSKDTSKKIAIFAGSLGLAAASAKKWTDATQAALLAVPQLEAGQTNFVDAMFSTASSVARSGLSIEELTGAMRDNRIAFKQNTSGIVDAIGENRLFAAAMGLNNEQLAGFTARTSNMNNAQGDLTAQTRAYIFNLEEVAIQTGRQASEIEQGRAAAREGTANLSAFMTEAGSKMLQGAITVVDDKFGPGMSSAVNNILGDGSTIFDMANNAGKNLRDLALAANNSGSEQEALALAGRAQIAIRNRDEAEIAQITKETAALSSRIAKEGLSDRADLNSAGLAGVKAESDRNKIIKENGKTERESINALINAQKAQAIAINNMTTGPMADMANTFTRISSLLSNFGSEILALGGLVIGLKNGFQLLSMITAVGAGSLLVSFGLLAGTALLLINNWDDMIAAFKDFPFLLKSILEDLDPRNLFKTDEEKKSPQQKKADDQERNLIVKNLKKRGIAVTQQNIDTAIKAFRGDPEAISFLDSLKRLGSKGVGLSPDSAISLPGVGGAGGVIPPSPGATKVTEPGRDKNITKAGPALPQPSSAFTPSTTGIEAPIPVLSELGEQVKKAKSMEDLLRLLNENAIVQTALLDVIAKSSGASGDIRTVLARSGVSLASLQGTR